MLRALLYSTAKLYLIVTALKNQLKHKPCYNDWVNNKNSFETIKSVDVGDLLHLRPLLHNLIDENSVMVFKLVAS